MLTEPKTAVAAAPKPVTLHRIHVLDRRARLRVAAPADRDALVALADRLAGVPDVHRALVRPSTGSIILETIGPVEAVLAALAERGIARIVQPPKRPPVQQVIQLGMLRADMGVKARTGEALDLRTGIALALLGGAILQLSRGRIAGPATTLAVSALSLLDRK
ncbi:hypothetical protein [Actibacterium sp. D379-3]